jgi:adenylate cyclase
MLELIAEAEGRGEQWSREFPADKTIVLGTGEWDVPWDKWISRRHAELTWRRERLRVKKVSGAANPIFFRGKELESFDVRPGERFVIGRTTFTLNAQRPGSSTDSKEVLQSRTISSQELRRIPFKDAPRRIDLLSRLPNIIASAPDETEMLVHLVNLLLLGVAQADAIAIVTVDVAGGETAPVQILHRDCRTSPAENFRPSHRLVREVIQQQQDTILHVWAAAETEQESAPYTLQGNFDWAFCTPVRGEACKGWGIYVTGRSSGDAASTILGPWSGNELTEDLKFVELVAAFLSSLRQAQLLQRKQAVLSHFFSPGMLPVLTEADPEKALRPRQTEVTVLFCDLRGFSRKVETAADHLFAVLERVSRALGVMTQNILENKGVIADFQGDAAMGFWGWPLEQPDKIEQACRAALGIRTLFESFAGRSDHPLADFQAGIGIATGTAVAGQIGTADQAKVTVFGPVVNLASRLEGMTKILRVPILLDETTARFVREHMHADVARDRRMAVVKPYGLEATLTVTELLPPAAQYPLLSAADLAHYEEALQMFVQGNWTGAYELLHRIPPQDRGKDFLLGYILQHNHTPPPGWNGVIPLESKT